MFAMLCDYPSRVKAIVVIACCMIVLILELVGFETKPIIITAIGGDREHEVCCPACQHRFQINNDDLGREMTCPAPGCGVKIMINPFVTQSLEP